MLQLIETGNRKQIFSVITAILEDSVYGEVDLKDVLSMVDSEKGMGNVITLASTLLKSGMKSEAKLRVIRSIASIPENEREVFIRYSKEFLPGRDVDVREIDAALEIVSNIVAIPEEKREVIVQHGKELFAGRDLAGFNTMILFGECLEYIAQIPEDDLEVVLEWSKEFIMQEELEGESEILKEFLSKASTTNGIGDAINRALEIFGDDSSLNVISKVMYIGHIADIPESERKSVIQHNKELFEGRDIEEFHTMIAFRDCLGYVAQIPENERKIVVQWSKELIMKKRFKASEELKMLKNFLSKVSTINGIGDAINRALEFFRDDMDSGLKIGLIEGIAAIPKEKRKEAIDYGKEFIIGKDPSKESTGVLLLICLRYIIEIPENEREDFIRRSKVLLQNESLPGYGWINALNKLFLMAISGKEIKNTITSGSEFFTDGMKLEEKVEIIDLITKVPENEREAFIQQAKRLFPSMGIDGIKMLAVVPEKERSFLNNPIYNEFMDDCKLFMYCYLLPEELRREESIRSLAKNGPRQFQNAITRSLEEKLSSYSNSRTTLVGLADFAIYMYKTMNMLSEDSRAVQLAIEIRRIDEIQGIGNPFDVHEQHVALSASPVVFTPPVDSETSLAFRMDMLQTIAKSSTITREDLPLGVTKEAFEQLIDSFTKKTQENPEACQKIFDSLRTNMVQIKEPIFGDPQRFLFSLLDITSGPVSDAEAKWKADIWNILDKSIDVSPGELFNEQELTFITTMMGIQHCIGGKIEGINGAYALLDDKYKYKIKISSGVISDEKKDAIAFLQQPKRTEGATRGEEIKELRKYCDNDTFTSSMHLTTIFGVEAGKCLDEDEETYTYRLNDIGASFALDMLEEIEKKECIDALLQHVQRFEESIIVDDNFLEKIVGQEVINGVHYSLYLRNRIGFVGLSNRQVFDPYTYILDREFLRKSQKELLDIFFKECTPEKLASYTRRKMDPNMPYIRRTLNREDFLEDGTIGMNGMRKLLELCGMVQKVS